MQSKLFLIIFQTCVKANQIITIAIFVMWQKIHVYMYGEGKKEKCGKIYLGSNI